ncbi:YncE family protein [Streptomyces sp. bgisy084]|uniref:YncE family protein n=1 Tax=Streptomyces sp. bgisy084 TaxID=3413777 RepID=UPI003D744DCC
MSRGLPMGRSSGEGGLTTSHSVTPTPGRKTAHAPDGTDRYVSPTGFSLNKGRFGDFPGDEDAAHQRGWRAYMTVGVPPVEERGDIAQPPPDVISKQTFVNRTDPTPTTWSHTVEFSISNTISWSLQGQMQLTFGAKTTASLQQQLQKSMAMNQSEKITLKNSKDNQGTDAESQSQATSTTTATSTATGTGELSAQLMLGITASVSGSLTTSFKTSSTLSGPVGSRVDVLATQRRQVRRFDYEFPVSFGGWVAVHYPEPVEVKETWQDGPQAKEPKYSKVLAWKLGETGTTAETFDLTDDGKPFMQKGEAEVVSTLAGVHEVFELEKLNFDMKDHPLHKDCSEERTSPKVAPVELATGLGTADGLALDLPGNRAYVTDVESGKLIEFDLTSRPAKKQRTWDVPRAAGVALNGGKAYIGQYDRGGLYEADLTADGGAPQVVASNLGNSVRVALDGAVHAYVADSSGGKLHEVVVADGDAKGRQRVVAKDLGAVCGIGLDRDNGWIYVSNRQGKLLRLSGVLPGVPARS